MSAEPIGEPLASGFRFRPASECPEAELSKEAKERVLAKIREVDRARLIAARDAHTYIVG